MTINLCCVSVYYQLNMNGIRKCIYMLISPSKKVYVGKSVCVKNRFRQYKALDKKTIGPALYRALQKYGWNNFVKVIIEVFDDNYEFLSEREIYWIKYHEAFGPKGYNCTTGGEGCEGRPCSKETRAKLSAKLKGRKGKARTAEQNASMIRGLRNYYENRTDEQKTKERQRNYQNARSQMKAVIATEKSTGIKREFESVNSAARILSTETGKTFNRAHISNCANKRPRYNSQKGWTFEFKE